MGKHPARGVSLAAPGPSRHRPLSLRPKDLSHPSKSSSLPGGEGGLTPSLFLEHLLAALGSGSALGVHPSVWFSHTCPRAMMLAHHTEEETEGQRG